MAIFEVNVTQDDIIRGEKGVCSSCPIARAILSIDPKVVDVCVGYGAISFSVYDRDMPNRQYRWRRRDYAKVSEFITKFDNGEPVQPFSFTLDTDDCIVHKFIDRPAPCSPL